MTVAEKPKVLFVDGEQRVLNSMRAMFGREYDLSLTTSGAEAVRIINGGNIDVVVADHGVTDVSGLDVLDWARVRSPDSVRVLIADYTVHDQIKPVCAENDIFLCLPKPCLPNKLRDAIRQAVEFAGESRINETSNTVAKPAVNAIPVDPPEASQAPGTVPPSSLPSEIVPKSHLVADAEQKESSIEYRRASDDVPQDVTGLYKRTAIQESPDPSDSQPKTAATASTLQSGTPADSTADRSEPRPKTAATASTLPSATPADSTPDQSEPKPKTAAAASTLPSATPADSTPDRSESMPKTAATASTLPSAMPTDSMPDRSEPKPKTAATASTQPSRTPADSTPDGSESQSMAAATASTTQSQESQPGANGETSDNAPEQPSESADSPLGARATNFRQTETQDDASVVVFAVEPTFIATARLVLEPRYGVHVAHSIIDSIECLCRKGSSILLMDVSGNAIVVQRVLRVFKVLVPDLKIIATVDNVDDESLSDLVDSGDGVQLYSKPMSAQICRDSIMAADHTRAGFAGAPDKAPDIDSDWQKTAGRAVRKAGGLEERLSRLAKRIRTS